MAAVLSRLLPRVRRHRDSRRRFSVRPLDRVFLPEVLLEVAMDAKIKEIVDHDDASLCDLCATEIPMSESWTCEKCGVTVCAFCLVDDLCKDCDAERE